MNRNRSGQRYVQLIMTFTAGLWLVAGSIVAQVELRAGSISGKVMEKSGGVPLPGATVTLSGIAAPQVFVTDSEGNYHFLNLSPGRYTIAAELSGMGRVQRAAEVVVGKNTEANFALAPSVAETITVTTATPVVDRRNTGTGANISQIELADVPTARDPWVVLQSVPGVLVDRVNVGGNKSGQQSYFLGKGVERHQTAWVLDGVPASDMQATGTSAFYYDFDSFQEMNISTGGADPSVQTPGVQINMVTKRGTNVFQGSGRWFWTSKSLQANPRVPSEGSLYDPPLTVANSVNRIDDYGLEAGGPVLADRLWLWGAASRNGINNIVSGFSSQYQKYTLTSYDAKLNSQLTGSNAGNLYWMYNNKTVLHRSIGPSRPVETSRNQSGPGYVVKAEDTHTFTPSFYVTGKLSHIKNGYQLLPVGGLNTNVFWDHDASIPHGSYKFYDQKVPQDAAHIDGANFVNTAGWNHELKYGFGYRKTPVKSFSGWPGNKTYTNIYEGDPASDYVSITRDSIISYGSNYLDAFVGDTVTVGNLTMTGGLRYDRDRAKNNGSSVPANPAFPDILPAASYAGDTRALVWKRVSPRAGLTYAIGQEKKTLLRASYSQYMEQLGSGDVGAGNPFYNIQEIYYYWNDLNGDKIAQRNEILFDQGVIDAKHVDPANPSSPLGSTGRIDYGMKPPKTDEVIVGAEREIMTAFAVGANLTYRKRTNFVWDRYEKTRGAGDYYTSADFVPVATPVTGTLPNGNAYSVSYYRLAPGKPAPIYTVTTNRPDYYQTYRDVELTATKRMENNWMLRAALTISRWKQHVGTNAIIDPSPVLNNILGSGSNSCVGCPGSTIVASNSGEDGYINSRWNFSLNGVYKFPYQITFGTALTARDGYVIPYYRRVNSRDKLGNRRILVNGFGNNRLHNVYELDLRLAKAIALTRGVGLELSADLFNALNKNTVLWRDNRLYSSNGADFSAGNNNIQEIQSPRIWRAGLRLRF